MQSQPQISLTDYSPKSIALRVVPEDYFKSYKDFLISLGGSWNPNLKYPDINGSGKLAGWIFPKTKQAQVTQGVQQILAGQVQPQPVYNQQTLSQGQNQTLLSLGVQQQPQQNTLQALLSQAQARNMGQAGEQSPISNAVPVQVLPTTGELPPIMTSQTQNQIPPGYQQVTYIVIKPEVGLTLYLNIGVQKIPVLVQSVKVNNNIVNEAVIQLPDNQQTLIRLVGDQWTIPGYTQGHSISLQ
jgi:hypothetical protein